MARAARAGASLLEELGRRRATHNPSFAEMLAAHLRVDPWGSRVAAPPPDPDDFYDALAQEVEAHAARVLLIVGVFRREPLPNEVQQLLAREPARAEATACRFPFRAASATLKARSASSQFAWLKQGTLSL